MAKRFTLFLFLTLVSTSSLFAGEINFGLAVNTLEQVRAELWVQGLSLEAPEKEQFEREERPEELLLGLEKYQQSL